MNLIEEAAKRERIARIEARVARAVYIDNKEEWIKEFIRKELQSEGMQFEAVTEPIAEGPNAKWIIEAHLAGDPAQIGFIVSALIDTYMHKLAEKAWQDGLQDLP
jgi:hypothetical protein